MKFLLSILCITCALCPLNAYPKVPGAGFKVVKHKKKPNKYILHQDEVFLAYDKIFVVHPGIIYTVKKLYCNRWGYYVYRKHLKKLITNNDMKTGKAQQSMLFLPPSVIRKAKLYQDTLDLLQYPELMQPYLWEDEPLEPIQ